jgi:hypothetical protein
MLNGIDFSFGSGLTTGQIKAGGKAFVCRYLSGGSPKDINKTELDNYLAAGIAVIFVWETDGQEFSEADGVNAAHAAQSELNRLGAGGAVVHFAQDIPEQSTIADQIAYMRGVNSVIGLDRSGGYGDYTTIKALFDAGVIKFGWETYGGSNGEWDDRALIRQVLNDVHFGPATVDLDSAAYWGKAPILTIKDDFGQWPRPKEQPVPSGPYRHVVPAGNTESLYRVARDRNLKDDSSLIALSRANLNAKNLAVFNAYVALEEATVAAGLPHAAMPDGLVYWTENK